MRFGILVMIAVSVPILVARSDTPSNSAESKAAPPAKLPTEAESMEAKLKYAQAILAAITRENYQEIEKSALALERISEGAEVMKLHKTEAYTLQARLFQQTMLTMAARAKEKNIEGVLLAYHDMSSSCLKCHRYIRDAKNRN